MLPTIAKALGVRVDERPVERSGLAAALRGRRMLLILDNFEHVIEAGPALSELIGDCAALTVLVTSRRVLRLRGEWEHPVGRLAVPSPEVSAPEALRASAAVRLFLDRISAIRPGLQLPAGELAAVAHLTRRLDGVPLALELAAARMRLLVPSALLERLASSLDVLRGGFDDLPERQRSLRATLDWSHDLLDDRQRTLLARLSTFVGG